MCSKTGSSSSCVTSHPSTSSICTPPDAYDYEYAYTHTPSVHIHVFPLAVHKDKHAYPTILGSPSRLPIALAKVAATWRYTHRISSIRPSFHDSHFQNTGSPNCTCLPQAHYVRRVKSCFRSRYFFRGLIVRNLSTLSRP